MKRFIKYILMYAVLIIGIVIGMLYCSSGFVKDKVFKNSQTESNTLIIKENIKYDLLLLGISHARNFSRYGNHEKMESILKQSIINLGQGGGICSVNEQFYYLDYFYRKGNHAKKVCIVLTPPMLTSDKLPIASNTFEKEIFEIDFLYNYLLFNSENKQERITNYIQTKFSKTWIDLKPDLTQGKRDSLTAIDKEKVKDGFKLAYGEKINYLQFKKSCNQVEEIIKLAHLNNTEVVLFIPPALFGKWPEHYETIAFLNSVEKKYNCKWKDFSESVTLPELYYDHHHLNTNGVLYFTNYFLKPFFNE